MKIMHCPFFLIRTDNLLRVRISNDLRFYCMTLFLPGKRKAPFLINTFSTNVMVSLTVLLPLPKPKAKCFFVLYSRQYCRGKSN